MASLNTIINDLTDFYLDYSPFEFSWEYETGSKIAEEAFWAKLHDNPNAISDEMENLSIIIENLMEQVEADPDDEDFKQLLRTATMIHFDIEDYLSMEEGNRNG